jgi:hypothetical protein
MWYWGVTEDSYRKPRRQTLSIGRRRWFSRKTMPIIEVVIGDDADPKRLASEVADEIRQQLQQFRRRAR